MQQLYVTNAVAAWSHSPEWITLVAVMSTKCNRGYNPCITQIQYSLHVALFPSSVLCKLHCHYPVSTAHFTAPTQCTDRPVCTACCTAYIQFALYSPSTHCKSHCTYSVYVMLHCTHPVCTASRTASVQCAL